MSSLLSFRAGLPIVVLGLLLLGCGGNGSSTGSDWTIRGEGLTLTETLRAGDDKTFYFSEIHDVAVRGDGRMYVADGKASHVKVLSRNGMLQDTLGRQGSQGPGAFERPSEVSFGHGDSLYVFDSYYSRLSVFAPNHAFSYRLSLRIEPEGKVPFIAPSNVLPRSTGPGFVASFGVPPLPGGSAPSGRAVRRIDGDGSVGDTLFTTPEAQAYIERRDRSLTIYSIPFARAPTVRQGPADHVHYAWSDSLGVRTYSVDGTLRRTVNLPFEPVPVTEADRERKLSGRSKESRAAVEDKIPATKPAFEHFLVDDEGRYWFGRPTANPDSTAWWVAWPEEERIVTTTLPSEVQLHEVTNGRAYGQTTTENGAPLLVRYRIRIDN